MLNPTQKDDLYSGGFFDLKVASTNVLPAGQFLGIRRDGPNDGGPSTYTIRAMKAYETPNLLALTEITATITADTSTPKTADDAATNLLTNLESRNGGSNTKPVIDLVGNEASYNSCFKVEQAPSNLMVLGLDLGEPLFLHGILIAEDQRNGNANANIS